MRISILHKYHVCILCITLNCDYFLFAFVIFAASQMLGVVKVKENHTVSKTLLNEYTYIISKL